MAKRLQVTFDTADPHRQAAWWAELLGYQVEDHHETVSGLLDSGVLKESDAARFDGRLAFAEVATAIAPDGDGPRLYFQRVPEAKVAKNRVHVDVPVDVDQLEAEVERVVATGATLVEYGEHPGERWAVMQDPEGNEFCLH